MEQKKLPSMAVNEYIAWIAQTFPKDTALHRMAEAYLKEESQNWSDAVQDETAPFLSIVTRTQGKRPEMLMEMLLSLTAQSNTNFELLITGHNLTEEQHTVVSDLISELPDWMRAKTRLVPVNGGTRATPLTVGFEEARGRYIAVLDDDDIVFDHWVETFYQLSKEHNGKILHAYSLIQDWETVGVELPNTPRAAGAPDTIYCSDFDVIVQLTNNRCPFCALAFPAFAYKTLGIHFDETLTTTEDWDFLMRTAFVTGVADSSEIIFLYRRWLNAENSASLHAQEEWQKNSHYVAERFSKTPFVVPVGALQSVYDKFFEADKLCSEDIDFTELFYDDGLGFAPGKLLRRKNAYDHKHFPFVYDVRDQETVHVCGLRFDPREEGLLELRDLIIRVIDKDGKEFDFDIGDIKTNGYVCEEKIVFLKSDPQIVLFFKKPIEVKEVWIGCFMSEYLSDRDLDLILSSKAVSHLSENKKSSIFYRGARKIYRLMKKILLKKS